MTWLIPLLRECQAESVLYVFEKIKRPNSMGDGFLIMRPTSNGSPFHPIFNTWLFYNLAKLPLRPALYWFHYDILYTQCITTRLYFWRWRSFVKMRQMHIPFLFFSSFRLVYKNFNGSKTRVYIFPINTHTKLSWFIKISAAFKHQQEN